MPEDHLSNLKNIGKFWTKKTYAKIGQSWVSDAWTNSLPTIVKVFNAFYNPLTNEFVMPAGILNDFMLDAKQPMYLNFGTTASIIGHEIIHGFDSSGRNFDKNGSLFKLTLKHFMLLHIISD